MFSIKSLPYLKPAPPLLRDEVYSLNQNPLVRWRFYDLAIRFLRTFLQWAIGYDSFYRKLLLLAQEIISKFDHGRMGGTQLLVHHQSDTIVTFRQFISRCCSSFPAHIRYRVVFVI